MVKRCASTCKNRDTVDCNKTYRCSYTNGKKRKYCRLSGKYKMNKPNCNITRRFTKKTAAKRIQQFVRSRKTQIKILKTPPGPTTLEIREFHNKVQARRLSRFMKKVDPNKRRAAFLNGVCSDAGVCIAFGKESTTIKKHFGGFADFTYLSKPVKRIGSISANGFVKELTYENAGYIAHSILKFTMNVFGDNLFYEYLVGKFINKRALQFPCFVETYDVFDIPATLYSQMKGHAETPANELLGITKYSHYSSNIEDHLTRSCKSSLYTSILIQHIKDAKTILDKSKSVRFTKVDLLYVLFQVYMPLNAMMNEFTHYDLHSENVLVYEPVKDSYIQYHYHVDADNVVSFKSAYIAKIIDYGRAFFNDSENPDINGSSKRIYDQVCKTRECNPKCGEGYGYYYLEKVNKSNITSRQYISGQVRNRSHDLRLLDIIANSIKKDYGDKAKEMTRIIQTINNPLFQLCSKVNYKLPFGTSEMAHSGLPNKINIISDARIALQQVIELDTSREQNDAFYADKSKLGDMHVYMDGSPLRFIAAV